MHSKIARTYELLLCKHDSSVISYLLFDSCNRLRKTLKLALKHMKLLYYRCGLRLLGKTTEMCNQFGLRELICTIPDVASCILRSK